jgi:hypothetical protein
MRRVREVPISVITKDGANTAAPGTAVTVTRVTNEPSAYPVRLVRTGPASGVVMHEELSDGLFDEINNVLDANILLASGTDRFLFGEEVYYRVYAERHHVQDSEGALRLLLRTACRNVYGPFLFWLTAVAPQVAAEELAYIINNSKSPHVRSALRAIILFGEPSTGWLSERLENKYKRHPQPPDFYWFFKNMAERKAVDRRLRALQCSPTTLTVLPDANPVAAQTLLSNGSEATGHLTRACMKVFKGEGKYRRVARELDILAYGQRLLEAAPEIWPRMKDLIAI